MMNTVPLRKETPAFAPESLFRLLSEFVVLLLGALLILLALSGRVRLHVRPAALMLLAALFIYLAARAWIRRQPGTTSLQTHIRAGSLALVGILILAIPFLPRDQSGLLLGIAGAVLVLRGMLGGILSLRRT